MKRRKKKEKRFQLFCSICGGVGGFKDQPSIANLKEWFQINGAWVLKERWVCEDERQYEEAIRNWRIQQKA